MFGLEIKEKLHHLIPIVFYLFNNFTLSSHGVCQQITRKSFFYLLVNSKIELFNSFGNNSSFLYT